MQYLEERTLAASSPKFTDEFQAVSAFSVSTAHPELYKLLTTKCQDIIKQKQLGEKNGEEEINQKLY